MPIHDVSIFPTRTRESREQNGDANFLRKWSKNASCCSLVTIASNVQHFAKRPSFRFPICTFFSDARTHNGLRILLPHQSHIPFASSPKLWPIQHRHFDRAFLDGSEVDPPSVTIPSFFLSIFTLFFALSVASASSRSFVSRAMASKVSSTPIFCFALVSKNFSPYSSASAWPSSLDTSRDLPGTPPSHLLPTKTMLTAASAWSWICD